MASPDIEPKYYQSAEVKLELQIVRSYSRTVFDKFIISGLLSTGEKVKLETLVALLREKLKSGESLAVNSLASTILFHSKSLISATAYKLAGGNRERANELIGNITSVMWEKLLTLDGRQQFWEANFKTCIFRTAYNCLKQITSSDQGDVSLTTTDGTGSENDRLEYLPDFRSPDPVNSAIIHSALDRLNEQERAVIILSVREQWTHQEIGEKLGITDRTVRNILIRIERKFIEWREESSRE